MTSLSFAIIRLIKVGSLNKNLNLQYLKEGDFINIEDNINLTVLAPSYIQEENNLNSIVFRIDYKNKSFLFTGDAEASNEMSIINSYELNDIDFLKVGHHGSSSSTTSEFIEEVSPDVAVISCGYKNQYGHPQRSTLDTLEKKLEKMEIKEEKVIKMLLVDDSILEVVESLKKSQF